MSVPTGFSGRQRRRLPRVRAQKGPMPRYSRSWGCASQPCRGARSAAWADSSSALRHVAGAFRCGAWQGRFPAGGLPRAGLPSIQAAQCPTGLRHGFI